MKTLLVQTLDPPEPRKWRAWLAHPGSTMHRCRRSGRSSTSHVTSCARQQAVNRSRSETPPEFAARREHECLMPSVCSSSRSEPFKRLAIELVDTVLLTAQPQVVLAISIDRDSEHHPFLKCDGIL